MAESQAFYRVDRVQRLLEVCCDWDAPAWRDVAAVELTHFMGERPAHFPRTRVKLLHDGDAVGVMFHVEDRYVRAIAREHQGEVWKDSCVEFFFAPADVPGAGYLNLEMNCGGVMLFHHQTAPWQDRVPVTPEHLGRIELATTLGRVVEPEIAEPVTWMAAYRLPMDMIASYCPSMKRPASGVRWRANFNKCAEHNSHPHWLTWARVDHPRPNFHMPEYFGTIEFA